jgi:hypothetical protein
MPKESALGNLAGSTPSGGDGMATNAASAPELMGLEVEAASQAVQPRPWMEFLQTAKDREIKERFAVEIGNILHEHGMGSYCALALFEPDDSIDSYDLDQIFNALSQQNADRSKDVLLLLLSRGGSIESAYQISKLCKSFAKKHFVALVPRHAKSAATLIAIGADEIHMGPLGQLGPIDPQLDGLPALGVSQALRTIASVAQSFPGSAEMFAKYLRLVLTVEQIGYCDRISESAVQYAVRLLSTKPNLVGKKAEAAAKELVHEYKDHGFVIDFEEATMHLGADWVKTGTPELAAAEEIYSHFDFVNFCLGLAQSKRLMVSGSMTLPSSIVIFKKRKE